MSKKTFRKSGKKAATGTISQPFDSPVAASTLAAGIEQAYPYSPSIQETLTQHWLIQLDTPAPVLNVEQTKATSPASLPASGLADTPKPASAPLPAAANQKAPAQTPPAQTPPAPKPFADTAQIAMGQRILQQARARLATAYKLHRNIIRSITEYTQQLFNLRFERTPRVIHLVQRFATRHDGTTPEIPRELKHYQDSLAPLEIEHQQWQAYLRSLEEQPARNADALRGLKRTALSTAAFTAFINTFGDNTPTHSNTPTPAITGLFVPELLDSDTPKPPRVAAIDNALIQIGEKQNTDPDNPAAWMLNCIALARRGRGDPAIHHNAQAAFRTTMQLNNAAPFCAAACQQLMDLCDTTSEHLNGIVFALKNLYELSPQNQHNFSDEQKNILAELARHIAMLARILPAKIVPHTS